MIENTNHTEQWFKGGGIFRVIMSLSFSIRFLRSKKNSESKTLTIQDKLRFKKSPEVFLFETQI